MKIALKENSNSLLEWKNNHWLKKYFWPNIQTNDWYWAKLSMILLRHETSKVRRDVSKYFDQLSINFYLRHIASKSLEVKPSRAKMRRIWSQFGTAAPLWLQILLILAKKCKKLPFCRKSLMDFDAISRSTSINFLSDLTSTHRVKPLTRRVEVKTWKV